MDTATLLDNLRVCTAIRPSVIDANELSIEVMTDAQREAVWAVCRNGRSLAFGMSVAYDLIGGHVHLTVPPKAETYE